MIYFDKVTKRYSDHDAVANVTFGIESGEFLSIVGHSGAGKTSLLRLLLVEDKPTAGAVFFEKTNVHHIRASSVPEYRRRIGTVFQDYR
jgi:cell division transport system ATP-binding protein